MNFIIPCARIRTRINFVLNTLLAKRIPRLFHHQNSVSAYWLSILRRGIFRERQFNNKAISISTDLYDRNLSIYFIYYILNKKYERFIAEKNVCEII